MPIDFRIGTSPENMDLEPEVSFEHELADYLLQLKPHVDISVLTNLDFYEITVLKPAVLELLEKQLDELGDFLADVFQQTSLSSDLEPPSVVGAEDEPRPFGRRETLSFIADLKRLIHEAKRRNRTLIAVGD
jgi:hypothetical protein